MSKNNDGVEEYDDNIQRVGSPRGLPYSYIPYHSIARARVNHPNDLLYVFEPGSPVGYKIVAYPLQMTKPKETDDAQG